MDRYLLHVSHQGYPIGDEPQPNCSIIYGNENISHYNSSILNHSGDDVTNSANNNNSSDLNDNNDRYERRINDRPPRSKNPKKDLKKKYGNRSLQEYV